MVSDIAQPGYNFHLHDVAGGSCQALSLRYALWGTPLAPRDGRGATRDLDAGSRSLDLHMGSRSRDLDTGPSDADYRSRDEEEGRRSSSHDDEVVPLLLAALGLGR